MGSVGSSYRINEIDNEGKKGSIRDIAYENMTEDSGNLQRKHPALLL